MKAQMYLGGRVHSTSRWCVVRALVVYLGMYVLGHVCECVYNWMRLCKRVWGHIWVESVFGV